MPRRVSDEHRVLAYIETASREQLLALIQTAGTVSRAKFPEEPVAKAALRRGRPAGSRNKGNGKEAPGVGFEPAAAE